MSRRILDEAILRNLDRDSLQRYFELYFKNAVKLIDELKGGVEGDDNEFMRQKSHKLKGSSIVVGAIVMKDRAWEVEELARDNQHISMDKITALTEGLAELKNELRENYAIMVE